MPRIRTVKPALWESESLAQTPIEARFLFIGLWTESDDEGRLRDNPRLLRSHLYPYDDEVTVAVVNEWLGHLLRVGSVCRYEVDGESFLHVPEFLTHQVINKPVPSRLPPCKDHPVEPKPSRRRAVAPEPSRRCPRHQDTTKPAPPCGECKEARMAHDKWQQENPTRRPTQRECGSTRCGCDHTECDLGWIEEAGKNRKCPACFPRPVEVVAPIRDARALGADYADHAKAAAGDRE